MLTEMEILTSEYIRVKDWQAVRRKCGKGTLLAFRTLGTCRKYGVVLISRLKHFSPEELDFFIQSTMEERRLLAWVAVCRCHSFIRDFMTGVVRERYLSGMMEVTFSDYASFFNDKAQYHPEMTRLSVQTQGKIRQMVFKMMAEAGIIENKTRIVPTILPPRLLKILPREDCLNFPMFVGEN